jgi:DNA-binding NarL/FixJ family response regulator
MYHTLPVVIFTMNPEEPYALRFFKLGASAFIRKDTQPLEIVRILGIVSTGRKYYSPSQIDMLAESVGVDQGSRKTHNDLTNREIQVLNLLATGRLKGEIAQKLDVSKNTVSNHRNNILKKLNLRNNSELTRFAILNGLVS